MHLIHGERVGMGVGCGQALSEITEPPSHLQMHSLSAENCFPENLDSQHTGLSTSGQVAQLDAERKVGGGV